MDQNFLAHVSLTFVVFFLINWMIYIFVCLYVLGWYPLLKMFQLSHNF